MSPATDWLARKVGGVIDFRLASDPPAIPVDVLRDRMAAYLLQLHAQTTVEKQTRAAVYQPADWRDHFGMVKEDEK